MIVTRELEALRAALRDYGRPRHPASEDLREALVAVACGAPPPDPGWLRALGGRRRSTLAMREGAASLLVQLGAWDGHEDLELLASGLLAPPPRVDTDAEMQVVPRLDATGIPLRSIDSADPHEVDDAIYAERDGADIRLWVAIAAPGCWIAPGDPADLAARQRGASLYHPRYHAPMLDPDFCERCCSLLPGSRRPALLFRFRLSPGEELVSEALDLAWVEVREAWTYDDADAALTSDDAPEWLRAAADAALQSEASRIARGAYLLYRADVEVRAPSHGALRIRPAPQVALARRVVSEAMVRVGIAAAAWLELRGIPAPFRGHAAVRPPSLPPGLYVDPADVRAVLAAMGPARVQARSCRHDILGAAAYAQAGSPLRRYGDLLVQHQILAHLAGRAPPFEAGPLLDALRASEGHRKQLRRHERNGRRYFQLLDLAGRGLGTTLRAQVQAGDSRRPPRAHVVDLALEVDLPSYAGSDGEWVNLRVEAVDPLRGKVEVTIDHG